MATKGVRPLSVWKSYAAAFFRRFGAASVLAAAFFGAFFGAADFDLAFFFAGLSSGAGATAASPSTSCMNAIGAESPGRGSIFRMRV
jgi:hypothetical protein